MRKTLLNINSYTGIFQKFWKQLSFVTRRLLEQLLFRAPLDDCGSNVFKS